MVTAVVIATVFVFVVLIFLAAYWPFSRQSVVKQLEDVSRSRVEVGDFHRTYFPRPGCVLQNVIFHHNPKTGAPPLITVEKMRVEGTFAGIFRKHVRRINAEGMHIFIPPPGTEHFETPARSTVIIDDLIADGAILDVASRQPGKAPLRFAFHSFTLNDVGSHGPASFQAKLSNPEPPGEINTTGKFGPWNADDVGKTPVSGEYVFQHADLGVFHGISGLLSSAGKFAGMVNRIEVEGTTDVPQFAVTRSSHEAPLRTQFHAVVNAENGDTFLQRVTANFRRTTVWSEGSVAGKADQPGKTASLELATKDGRIQDILLLFAKSQQAPMSGMVSFKAKALIPPGRRPFLEKVELRGDFGIDAGSFTRYETQEGVNSLSEGARGEKDHRKSDKDEAGPETVLSDLKGHVFLKDGTARFSDLSFTVPGAEAHVQGTYNLITEKIDLHGTLRTDAEVSKTTHGVKALLLKFLDPFLKKKPLGYIAPIKITGTYGHPAFGLDLDRDDKKDEKADSSGAREMSR
jgi:hypothetical protein